MLGTGTEPTATAADQTVTIIVSVLGGVLGVAAIVIVIIFIILPRRTASQAAVAKQAGRPAADSSGMMVHTARPRQQRTRWSPGYIRTRPSAYLPHDEVEVEQMMPVYAVLNHRFDAANQVPLYCISFRLCTVVSAWV